MNRINKSKNIITKFFGICSTFKWELCIFTFFFISLLCTLPNVLHEWNASWYAMDYSLGLDSRLLIGSFLRLFYPDFLPADKVYAFVLFSILILLILLSYILGHSLRQTSNTPAGRGMLLLIIIYLLCPGSPSYLWSAENMGRFDLYLILITLIAAVFAFKVSSVLIRLIAFTLLGIAALSIHQVFMFIFFPILFVLFMDTIQEGRQSKTAVLSSFCCIGCLGIVFLYFQFFSSINPSSLEELTSLLSGRTDLPINEIALRYEYFSSISVSFKELMLNMLGERIRYGAITLFLLAPLWIIYGYLWINILKTAKVLKFKYWLILLSQLCFLPAFALTMDWGRWFGAYITVLVLQIVILAAKKDAVILSALTKLQAVFLKHPYLFIAAGLWVASLDKFQATVLPNAPVFFTSLYNIYTAIF